MSKILIEKLVTGGDGLGWIDGRPVFVPLTAPGDLITTDTIRRRRGVCFADVREIVESSPLRRDPPCPYYGRCGGCGWMHMSYGAQIQWKGMILAETIQRIGGIKDFPPVEAVPSPEEFSWRYRIRLHHRNGALGFFKRGSHDLVCWDMCLIIPHGMNTAADVLRAVVAQEGKNLAIESVELAVSPVDSAVSVLWHVEKGKKFNRPDQLMARTEAGLGKAGVKLSCQGVFSGSPPRVREQTGKPLILSSGRETTFASPGTFFQVNPQQNRNVVSKVLSVLRERRVRSMVDLFCGNGNFSIPASRQGVRVTGVESSPGAVADSEAAAGGEKMEFINSDVESFLASVPDLKADAVLVDPPRSGLSDRVRADLISRVPETVVYVSCDPATLARDLRSFLESGYNLVSLEAFDMFPNSAHIEALAVLERK